MVDWRIASGEEDLPAKLEALAVPNGEAPTTIFEAYLREHTTLGAASVKAGLRTTLDAHGGGGTLVIERGYFDLDGRSERSTEVEKRFVPDEDLGMRVHLFEQPLTLDDFETLLEAEHPAVIEDGALRPHGYLGYVIPRYGRGVVRAGRSLVYPPEDIEGLAVPAAARVRTLVTEPVELLGVPLTATGVPFMQQDGVLLSCAHVTAWMAQYSMTLQGFAPRVAVAHLRGRETGHEDLYGRQYPTPGWSDSQILGALRSGGLSPSITAINAIGLDPRDSWHRREDIAEENRQHRADFAAYIARYLNSGIPLIVTRSDHVLLVCGYIRNRDLTAPTAWETEHPSTVHSFVVHDEAEGPYRLVPVADLLRDEGTDEVVVVPTPKNLHLGGADAEDLGAYEIEKQLKEIVEFVEQEGDDSRRQRIKESLSILDGAEQARGHALRTFAAFNSDLKLALRNRLPSPELRRMVMTLRLPRFVWVVEVIDRELRAAGRSSVRGMVIIDATDDYRDASPVLVWTPGYIKVRDLVTGALEGAFISEMTLPSGRWAHAGSGPIETAWTALRRVKSVPSALTGPR